MPGFYAHHFRDSNETPERGLLLALATRYKKVYWWLHDMGNEKARYVLNSRLSIYSLVGRE